MCLSIGKYMYNKRVFLVFSLGNNSRHGEKESGQEKEEKEKSDETGNQVHATHGIMRNFYRNAVRGMRVPRNVGQDSGLHGSAGNPST